MNFKDITNAAKSVKRAVEIKHFISKYKEEHHNWKNEENLYGMDWEEQDKLLTEVLNMCNKYHYKMFDELYEEMYNDWFNSSSVQEELRSLKEN